VELRKGMRKVKIIFGVMKCWRSRRDFTNN